MAPMMDILGNLNKRAFEDAMQWFRRNCECGWWVVVPIKVDKCKPITCDCGRRICWGKGKVKFGFCPNFI
jgi:hypothetical protein